MITHYVSCISNSEKERKQITSEKSKLEDEREAKDSEYKTVSHDLEQSESLQLQTEKKKIEIGKMLSSLEKERVKQNYELSITIKDLSNISSKKSQYESKIQQLEGNLSKTQTKLEDEKERFKNVDIQKSKHGGELESVEAKLQFLNSNLNQFKKFKSVEDRNRYLQTELKEIDKKATRFNNLIKNTEGEIRELIGNKNSDLKRLDESKVEIQNLENLEKS